MQIQTLELDNFIDPTVGAEFSFHSISWNGEKRRIPSAGRANMHLHALPSGGTAPHSHEFAELIFMLSGSIIHHVNGEKQQLEANDIAFVRPSDFHGFLPSENGEHCELLLLSFCLEFFHTISQYLEDDEFLHRYTEGVLPPVFRLPENQMNEITIQLLNMKSENHTPALRKIHFKILLLQLFTRCFLEMKQAGPPNAPEWLRMLCKKMRQPENLSAGLKRMQKLSGYTPEYLCKMFRQCLGQSPTEFLNELRINHAARQLADTDITISAITFDLNFQSLSRFYHLFKKQYACTPAEYRKRALATKQLL